MLFGITSISWLWVFQSCGGRSRWKVHEMGPRNVLTDTHSSSRQGPYTATEASGVRQTLPICALGSSSGWNNMVLPGCQDPRIGRGDFSAHRRLNKGVAEALLVTQWYMILGFKSIDMICRFQFTTCPKNSTYPYDFPSIFKSWSIMKGTYWSLIEFRLELKSKSTGKASGFSIGWVVDKWRKWWRLLEWCNYSLLVSKNSMRLHSGNRNVMKILGGSVERYKKFPSTWQIKSAKFRIGKFCQTPNNNNGLGCKNSNNPKQNLFENLSRSSAINQPGQDSVASAPSW